MDAVLAIAAFIGHARSPESIRALADLGCAICEIPNSEAGVRTLLRKSGILWLFTQNLARASNWSVNELTFEGDSNTIFAAAAEILGQPLPTDLAPPPLFPVYPQPPHVGLFEGSRPLHNHVLSLKPSLTR
jgi:hypothetical protein